MGFHYLKVSLQKKITIQAKLGLVKTNTKNSKCEPFVISLFYGNLNLYIHF